MDESRPFPSTLRFRQNAAEPSQSDGETGSMRPKSNGSMRKQMQNGSSVPLVRDHGNSGAGNIMGGVRATKSQKTKKLRQHRRFVSNNTAQNGGLDWSLRCLIPIAVFLMLLVVGGLAFLAHLVLVVDPDLQKHFPHLQKYFNDEDVLWDQWSTPSQLREENKSSIVNDNASILNSDALESDTDGETVNHSEASISELPSEYTIPNSMDHIGDKSEEYARLRQEWEEKYPSNTPERSLRAVKELLANGPSSIYSDMQPPPMTSATNTEASRNEGDISMDENDYGQNEYWNYDIYDCPDDPPPGYPREYKTIDILKHWPPSQSLPVGSNLTRSEEMGSDSNNAPIMAHLGLCVFDYNRDYEKAIRYRSAEMPFVVRNDPSVAETVERWNNEDYRRKLFGTLSHGNRKSVDDHDENDNNSNGGVEIPERVYHRAERSMTNQVLFRQSKKKKPPKFNGYPASNNGQTKAKKRKREGIRLKEELSPPMPPPTKFFAMTYDQWYTLAMAKEKNSTIDNETGIQYYDSNLNLDKSLYYYYLRLVGCGEKDGCERNSTEYLFDELPFFQPREQPKPPSQSNRSGRRSRRRGQEEVQSSSNTIRESPTISTNLESLYLVDSGNQRGIHCRFGMPGMIAVNHYDASRNAITVLGGSRRYIVSRPDQCVNLGLYPVGHPSARHSKVDWTTAFEDYQDYINDNNETQNGDDSESPSSSASTLRGPSWKEYRESLLLLANNAASTEVILQAGDVLYLPTYWFHFIISLTTNMQCNTRSGRDGRDNQIMEDCGFPHKI